MGFDTEWSEMSLVEQMAFSEAWDGPDKMAQWARVRTIGSTRMVLQILFEITNHRSNIEVYRREHGITGETSIDYSQINTSEESLNYAAIQADTDGVVRHDPKHAGGWWGLLTLGERQPTISAGAFPIRMPPGMATLMGTLDYLLTYCTGSEENMRRFVEGQRASAGSDALEHLALTFKYLIWFNKDDLVIKYLLALRGHHEDDERHNQHNHHHLNDMVRPRSDRDERKPRRTMTRSFDILLKRFPQVFSRVASQRPAQWSALVGSELLDHWSAAIGNHDEGEAWLRTQLTSAQTAWGNTDAMVDLLEGTRVRERTEAESWETKVTELVSQVTTLRVELITAQEQTTSQERIESLERARGTVRGWRLQTSESGTSETTASGSSETEVEGDILVAAAKETIVVGLEQKIGLTIAAEQETSGSSSSSTTRTISERAAAQWRSLLSLSRSYQEEMTREVSRSQSYGRSASNVIAIRDVHGQVTAIKQGIDLFVSDEL